MKIIENESGFYFNGTPKEVDMYLTHIRTAKHLTVRHYEDELAAEELIAEEKRESDSYDLSTCHEQ